MDGTGMAGIDPNTLLASMGNNKNGQSGDNIMLFVLLLLFLGKDGLGGSAAAAEGIRSTATQNDISQQTQFLSSQHTNLLDRISDSRNSNDVHALTNMSAIKDSLSVMQAGNAALSKEICACCCSLGIEIKGVQNSINMQACETRNAIERSSSDTLNAICNQTNTLTAQGVANTQRVVDLINQNQTNELQQKLFECQTALSNAQQTSTLEKAIRDASRKHHWHAAADEPTP